MSSSLFPGVVCSKCKTSNNIFIIGCVNWCNQCFEHQKAIDDARRRYTAAIQRDLWLLSPLSAHYCSMCEEERNKKPMLKRLFTRISNARSYANNIAICDRHFFELNVKSDMSVAADALSDLERTAPWLPKK